MVSALAFLTALIQQQPNPTVFTEQILGPRAFAAFSNPETVTIQSVYPAIRKEKVERQFGPMPLRFVAKLRPIARRFIEPLIQNFSHPYRVLEPHCVFHPDHLISFSRGADKVEAISCFTCDELMVMANGKYIGRVSMGPPKQLRMIFTSSVPLTDTMRSATEEWLSREAVVAFDLAAKGTITRSSLPLGAMPARLPALSSKPAKLLDAKDIALLFGILESHCMNNRLSFRFAQPDLPKAVPPQVTVRLSSKPEAALVFYAAYSRAQLYVDGKQARIIDLYGIEDRLQKFLISRLGK